MVTKRYHPAGLWLTWGINVSGGVGKGSMDSSSHEFIFLGSGRRLAPLWPDSRTACDAKFMLWALPRVQLLPKEILGSLLEHAAPPQPAMTHVPFLSCRMCLLWVAPDLPLLWVVPDLPLLNLRRSLARRCTPLSGTSRYPFLLPPTPFFDNCTPKPAPSRPCPGNDVCPHLLQNSPA